MKFNKTDNSPAPHFIWGRGEKRACPASGLTLIELLVVLVILIGVGSLVIATLADGVTVRDITGENRSPESVTTLATMRQMQEALVGTSTNQLGFFQHAGFLPVRAGALIEDLYNQGEYQPTIKRGWQGPYLTDIGIRYDAEYIANILGAGFFQPATTIPWSISNQWFSTSEIILQNDDPIIPDAWGNPIVLGFGTHTSTGTTEHAYLVSAGENRILETDLSDADYDADNDGEHDGDDLVLFLLTSDPN